MQFFTQVDYIGYIIADLPGLLLTEDCLQATFFFEYIGKTFPLQYYINWLDFITRLCLLHKLFNKMYFLSHA